MPIFGELSASTGFLSNIRYADAAQFADDVPLVAMPTGFGPFTYDSVNKVAVSAARVKRTLFAIRADLVALNATQKSNVWTALTAGSPPLWATDAGGNAAALAVLQLLGASGTLGASDVGEAKVRGAAMYVQDNPTWLVNPSFDTSINVPGDQPA